eukprot:scaffold14882_cov80-Cyclotella_meneghiniana.AAC.8
MTFVSCVRLSIFCLALTSVIAVGCQTGPSAQTADSSYSLSKIQSRTLSLRKKNRRIACIGNANSIVNCIKVRGGDADDRPVYDDRPRGRPLPPPRYNENGGRRVQGPPPNFDDTRQSDRSMNFRPDRYTRNKVNSSSVAEEKKGWFGSKNKAPVEKEQSQRQKPSPPPPPPNTFSDYNPAETERVPINYMFPTTDVAASERQPIDDITNDFDPIGGPDLPIKSIDDERRESLEEPRRRRRRGNDDGYASPRRDAVTIFMSTRFGAMKVRLGSIIVGAVLGFLRNDYGELSRALGLALIMTLQRTKSVRRQYPTMVHLKAMIRQGPRRPFPPVEEDGSPWRYEPVYEDDPEFKMTYALLAMALVGSFCGGNVPLLPQWIGGIVGAVLFASFTSGSNARGDLGRTMGMRVVGLLQLILKINTELRILGKAATVGGLVFDKVMIMDRKHRIKDRIVAICKWGYDKVSSTASEMQADLSDDRDMDRDKVRERDRKDKDEFRERERDRL